MVTKLSQNIIFEAQMKCKIGEPDMSGGHNGIYDGPNRFDTPQECRLRVGSINITAMRRREGRSSGDDE